MQATLDLFDKDTLNSGLTNDELNELKQSVIETYAKKLMIETANYTPHEKLTYLENIIPHVKANFNEYKDQYFEKRSKALLSIKDDNFNPNYWNKFCYKLFNYLMENYTAKEEKIVKYINIWYFLKDVVDKDKYMFNLNQDDYGKYIKSRFGVEIKKFAKAELDFDKQKSILKTLEQQFRRK